MDSLVKCVSVYKEDTVMGITQAALAGMVEDGARARVYATTADLGIVLSVAERKFTAHVSGPSAHENGWSHILRSPRKMPPGMLMGVPPDV